MSFEDNIFIEGQQNMMHRMFTFDNCGSMDKRWSTSSGLAVL